MKYYVVFKGHNPGVYDDWEEARLQTEGFPGASVKSFSSSHAASEANRKFSGMEDKGELGRLISNASPFMTGAREPSGLNEGYKNNPEIDPDAWAVDASCLGNPGRMEYRGVDLKTGKVLFRMGPFEDATNNIGEYLALVHAMALMTKSGEFHNIYTDSVTALSWWRRKKINTKLAPTSRNKKIFELLARASVWVNTHNFPNKIMKWNTDRWGEIPADFGRK